MGIAVKNNTAVGIEIESTEGTYVAPTGATKFVQTLSDGFEMKPAKELLERSIFTGSIGKSTPRTGQRTVSGTIPVEARANSTAGGAPEFDALMRSAMGSRRQKTSTTTTKNAGNTGSVLQIEDADISDFAVGDIVMIKQSGAYHVSPVSAVDDTPGSANITLVRSKASGSFSNSVVIEKFTTYTVADSGHPTLSISKYVENAILEQATGCRVTTLSLENFSTGQLPSFKFGFEGLDFDRSVTAIPYTPSYDSSLPPIILDAHVYMNGSEITVNEMTFSLENTLGFQTAVSASNGRVSGRATERKVSGSFNPYKVDNSVANFDKFVDGTEFSLFAYAQVPTSTSGQFGQVIAVYMPNCIITELAESDKDGLLQDAITFTASRGSAGTSKEIYIAFI